MVVGFALAAVVCVFVHVDLHGCVFWACVRVNELLCGCTNVCAWGGNTPASSVICCATLTVPFSIPRGATWLDSVRKYISAAITFFQ